MRYWIAVLVVCLTIAACGQAAAETTTSTTTTTTTAPTTTTRPPTFEIDDAPDDLVALVEDVYRGNSTFGLPALDQALVLPGAAADVRGEAGVATWGDSRIAVVEVEGDVLGLADDGSGWRFVAGTVDDVHDYPSLPAVFAVVGSDARPDEDQERTRADSIHLVGLPGDGSASMVGVPRDSYVPIPGHGTNRINASLSLGGPDLMMETFRSVTGIDVAGYVLTGFAGFQQLVSTVLGGLEIDVPSAFTDKAAKANFPAAGPQEVDGKAALSFARSRKAFAGGDFTRQLHGGLVLIGGAAAFKLRGPTALPGLLEGSHEWLSTDLDAAQLLELGLAVDDLDLFSITNVVLDGRSVTRNGASVVDLAAGAQDVFADLGDDARLEGD